MSDAKASTADAPPKDRTGPSIDLAATDVQDVTPKAQAAPSATDAPSDPPRAGDGPAVAPEADTPPPVRSASASWPVIGGAVAGAIFGLLGVTVHQNVQAPPVTVADPRVAQVESAIAAVEKKSIAASEIEQRLQAQIRTLEGRAKAAEERAIAAEQRASAAEQKATTASAPLDDRLKATETRIADGLNQMTALAGKLDQLAKIEPPKVDLGPLTGRLDALEKALGATSARVATGGEAASALDQRIKQAEQALSELTSRTASAVSAANAPATLATVALVRRALDGGEALKPHLAALAAQGVSESSIRPLSVFADAPAPRPALLADQLANLAAQLPRPAQETAKPAGLMDRLKAGLMSQVDVKPAGGVPADAAAAISKARAKVQAGDLAGGLAELQALSTEQRAVLKPFTDAVAARGAAYEAVKRIEADALGATARKS